MPGELRVLGAVEAVGPDGPAQLVGARQRALLGVLALHCGNVLPIARLVDVLWGEDPPRTAVKTLHGHVARIRRALTACGFGPVLVTRKPGYVLAVPAAAVDAHRFEELVRSARAELAAGATAQAAAGLRAALALWRAEAFADAELSSWGRHAVDRLAELRLSALAELWDVELRLGNHADAVRELPRLVAEHPDHEPLAGLHMLALYRSGRHADALAAFQDVRHGLAERFGVDPGPELVELHTAILQRDPALDQSALPAGPAQLPAQVGHFTGRATELSALDRLLESADELPIVVICGAAGMGKSALAVQWAYRNAARFPDGKLFLDLGGHEPTQALSAADALANLLRSLGVHDERMPDDLAERAARYRSLLDGKRCLIVADNAASVDQVLSLVPGGGRALLVVTSRHALTALGSRHAVRVIALEALADTDSLTLLARVLGEARIDDEPDAAKRLADLCAGMPLALRIAAARLTGEPGRPVAGLVAELAGDRRWETLAVDGDSRTVRSVLTSAYLPLGPAATRLFRLFGVSPGITVSPWLGAALCGVAMPAARAAAAELTAAHLLTPVGLDRFQFHDLIREFARHRAQLDEAEGALAVVADRLVDWYLTVAAEANRLIDPNRDRVTPDLRYPGGERPFPADRRAALEFLTAERPNLLPVVRFAREHGRPAAAWQLTYLLTSFYENSGHWYERIELCRSAVEAATELGDRAAIAEMLRALGGAQFMARRLHDALATNERALEAARAAGDLDGEGHVLNNTAIAYAALRQFDQAIPLYLRAVAVCAESGHEIGFALAQRNLGHAYIRTGRAAESIEPLTKALAAFRQLGNARLVIAALDTLGEAHLELGDTAAALAHFGEALRDSRAMGNRWHEWESLLHRGAVWLRVEDFAVALTELDQALVISRAIGDRHAEATTLDHTARAYLGAHDLGAARAHLMRALSLRTAVPDVYEEAHLFRDLAALEERCGGAAVAAAHRQKAIGLYRQANATAEADRLTAAARQ